MISYMRQLARGLRGRKRRKAVVPPDIDPRWVQTFELVRPFTQTSLERVAALCDAVRYLTHAGIPGDIVECGVWRGGSMMAAARTLLELDATDRELHLFDTYEGMTAPSALDVSLHDVKASDQLAAESRDNPTSVWCVSGLDEVRQNMASTGYPDDRVHYVAGAVEETLPQFAPAHIALLRLDTDWYESTRHELVHLFPRLSPGGVLIIDDYGHWRGARRAVDEYLAAHRVPLLLNRIDYTGRMGIYCPRP